MPSPQGLSGAPGLGIKRKFGAPLRGVPRTIVYRHQAHAKVESNTLVSPDILHSLIRDLSDRLCQPKELGLRKIMLNAGLSSQSLLLGKKETTVEALYLSHHLREAVAPVAQEQLLFAL